MTVLLANPEVNITLVPSTKSLWDFLIGFRNIGRNKLSDKHKFMIITCFVQQHKHHKWKLQTTPLHNFLLENCSVTPFPSLHVTQLFLPMMLFKNVYIWFISNTCLTPSYLVYNKILRGTAIERWHIGSYHHPDSLDKKLWDFLIGFGALVENMICGKNLHI